ncbi:MAG TPA: NUDIX hydrolase [Pirellulales bacterium]|jgi:ADP-ribose pyrophosphatase|nr:NUDIX hydrolase [Pirellulales bacterium]
MPENVPPDEELLLRARRFQVVRRYETLPDGSRHPRETVQHPGAVVILPLVAEDRVCLIHNYRIAVKQKLIELPAGTLEPGEDPAVTAARELSEETGFRAERIRLLHEFYMSPGILNERMRLFLATGLTAGETAREAGEQIDNWIVSWSDALAMVDDGRIQDAKTIAGLLFYDRLRQAGRG